MSELVVNWRELDIPEGELVLFEQIPDDSGVLKLTEEEVLEFLGLEQETFIRGKQSNDRLKLSLDRKVSPDGWMQKADKSRKFKGSRWVATIPNSFGLPAGKSCPGETSFCDGCYAKGSENGGSVSELVNHNLDMLQNADGIKGMTALIYEMVSRYDRFADMRAVAEKDRIFRIHWDGDFFSEEYAIAWANVVSKFPKTKFWVYTRSFVYPVNVVPHLSGIENLTVYLSVDKDNKDVAHQVATAYPDVKLALCADDYRRARELAMPERRTLICPENVGRIALMEDGKGACTRCNWCSEGIVDVMFSKTHVEDSEPQLVLLEIPAKLSSNKRPTTNRIPVIDR